MISKHFHVVVAREYFDRGRKVIGPKMKKCKLGRALESVREDFRVGKHTGLSVLRVRLSPRSFSSPCHPRRSVGLLSSSYHTRIPSSCERFSFKSLRGHVHARTCAICLRVQCPLILARYSSQAIACKGQSVGSTRKSVGLRYFQIGSKIVINVRINAHFIHIQFLSPHFLWFNTSSFISFKIIFKYFISCLLFTYITIVILF